MQSESDLRTVAQKIGLDPEYLAAFETKLFIQGTRSVRRLANFFVLLLLATVIATYGVILDSTATVIGAMLVAPLMSPIMATAAAVVIGSARHAWRSLALVAAGVASVILLAYLLTLIIPSRGISFTENSEIASRIAPGLLALLTALASGAAGAYITAREELADSMGGVAIAISLVPPLCVVGIGIEQGEWSAVFGALTLFMTNFLAILLAGGATLMFVGIGRAAISDQDQRMRRRSFALIALATILVVIPLSLTTIQVVSNALETEVASVEVDQWLEGSTHNRVNVRVSGSSVYATVEGSGDLPSLAELADALSLTLERPITVIMRTIPSQIQPSTALAAS
jgi:uncharacterized hydrophobic protein (TIGR00271 family)